MSTNSHKLSADQREVLELLCAELAEIMTVDASALFIDDGNALATEGFATADWEDQFDLQHQELAQLEFGDEAIVQKNQPSKKKSPKKEKEVAGGINVEAGRIEIEQTALEQESNEARTALLNQYVDHLEQLSKAMELVGLQGLQHACYHLLNNFHIISGQLSVDQSSAASPFQLDNDLLEQIPNWPLLVLNYLHCLLEEASAEDFQNAAQDLIDFASDTHWPQSIDAENLHQLQSQLSNLSLVNDALTDVDEEYVPHALNDSADSLEIAADVRTELLQGLLTELPGQSRVFEKSVETFLHSLDIHDLAPAQRIAHTIKGSANIVGIQGLANLMHFCEDLLELAHKVGDVPEHLRDVLMDTADCLGDTVDYLIGSAPQPTNLNTLLQALLSAVEQLSGQKTGKIGSTSNNDEAIDIDDIEGLDTTAIATEETQANELKSTFDSALHSSRHSTLDSTLDTKVDTNESDADDNEFNQTVSLPGKSALQLLRIAGEFQISNTQVTAQLDAMQSSIKQTELYHRRIKAMAMELEALLQTQSALRAAVYRSHAQDHDQLDASNSAAGTELDPLEMESYSELHSFSNQLRELTADSYEAVSHIGEQIKELHDIAYAQKQLNFENNELLLKAHMVLVDSIVPRLQRCVRQVSRLTGKTVTLNIKGEKQFVDGRVLNSIVDPLMHLLRNAVDHGIESKQERIDADKDPFGSIQVEFVQQGELLKVVIKDDGRGLDYVQILEKARQKSLVGRQQILEKNQLNRLLFLPGFSTREVADQTSGRGIGLDVVETEVKKLKGDIRLQSNPGEGCEFVLSLPASILTAHALIVKYGKTHNPISLLSRGIEQIVYVDSRQFQQHQTVYNFEENDIPLYYLQDLAPTHTKKSDAPITALLIVKRPDQSHVAVAVPNVHASQDLVIKPLNRFTYHPPGVVGATILGDGTVSPVINLHELPGFNFGADEYIQLQQQRAMIEAQQNHNELQLPLALIIDDSYSARQSLSQFVTELGMQVKTAKDGFEAITLLKENKPNIILVDLEMPRMNGLEFTTHIRSNSEFQDTPVIMITSRSTDKHRALAEKAGVSHYLNKPWSDEDLLNCIQQQMTTNNTIPAA